MEPESRRTRPEMARIRVVLPAPFGPSSPSHSPLRNSRLTLSRALLAPNVFTAFLTCSIPSFSFERQYTKRSKGCMQVLGDRRRFRDEMQLGRDERNRDDVGPWTCKVQLGFAGVTPQCRWLQSSGFSGTD